MAQQSLDYSTTEIDSDSEFDSPAKKKLIKEECASPTSSSSMANPARLKNGNQYMKNDKSKHANSAGEQSCNNTSSDDGEDVEISTTASSNAGSCDIVTKIKVSPSASIEIAKVHSDSSLNNKNYLGIKVENKLIQNVYRQELSYGRHPMPPKYLDLKDSGLSSCQESSQEFCSSPSEEGNSLVRTVSSTSSSNSVESSCDFMASQASTQLPYDSDDETDTEKLLTRVEEFTNERQEKLLKEQEEGITLAYPRAWEARVYGTAPNLWGKLSKVKCPTTHGL